MKLNRLSALSAYAKPESHLVQQTAHGAIVTMCGVLLATTLFVHELSFFLKLHRTTQMSVDLARRHDLSINLDIQFPAVPCAVLSIDVLDISGTAENDASYAKNMHLHKMRVDAAGKQIGKIEYHTPQSQQLVDTGGEQLISVNIQEALQHLVEMEAEAGQGEGCHLWGTMDVRRVAGRLHLSVHQSIVFQMLPQLLGDHTLPTILNMSHTIKSLGFGPKFPGQFNPLDGYKRVADHGKYFSYKYFLKVVPTEYYSRTGRVTETHQYSVTEYARPLTANMSPGVDVQYDLSPIVVNINEKPPSLLHFVVRMCAVIGGVFAITRLMDRLVHSLVTSLGKAPHPAQH